MRSTVPLALTLFLLCGSVASWAQQWTPGDPLVAAAAQIAGRFSEASQPKRGDVVAVNADTTPALIYVRLGSKDGILEGTPLTVVAKGKPILVDGAPIDYEEQDVGLAEVKRVQSETLCAAVMKSVLPFQKPAVGSVAYVKTLPGTLAVTTFLRPDGLESLMGQQIADKLQDALQQSGRFQTVERTPMEKVLAELGLSLNDLFNAEKAAQFGKLVQAKGIILGAVTQRNDGYTINARVVDIETGVQIATSSAGCPRTSDIDKAYDTIVKTHCKTCKCAQGTPIGAHGPNQHCQTCTCVPVQAHCPTCKCAPGTPIGAHGPDQHCQTCTCVPPSTVSGRLVPVYNQDSESLFTEQTKWIFKGAISPRRDMTVGPGVYWPACEQFYGENTVILNGTRTRISLQLALDSQEDNSASVEFIADGKSFFQVDLTPRADPVCVELTVPGVMALTIRQSGHGRLLIRQGMTMNISWC